jgi:hypothetical protein
MRVLRESLLTMLKADPDIRIGVRRIAAALDDLTRSRVVALSDEAFAEYVSLTLPHAANQRAAPPSRPPTRIGRLLQYGFLYAVAATRVRVEQHGRSPWQLRIANLRLLAHFHRIAPPVGHINVGTLSNGPIDLNAPDIRPIVFHYLRSSIESLGARERPLLEDLSLSASYLNAAAALAVMNSAAAGRSVDRQIFSEAVTQAAYLGHADDRGLLGGLLKKMTGGTEALWLLQSTR